MTRSKLFVVACLAATVVAGLLTVGINHGSEGQSTIENTLEVQKAMVLARDHLLRTEPKKAVEVLEANLSRINGDRAYLALLRDAYRSHIKDLALAHQQGQVEIYQKRLKILDDQKATVPQHVTIQPQAAPAATAAPRVETSTQNNAGKQPPPVPGESAPSVAPAASSPTPAYSLTKTDPFSAGNQSKAPIAGAAGTPAGAKEILAKAESEFAQKRYGAAKHLYEQANQADGKCLAEDARGRWAYCQLSVVIDQVNRSNEQPCDWTRLESEVKNAVQVAPHLAKTGDDILTNIAKRRLAGLASGAPVVRAASEEPVTVNHQPRGNHGWMIAETKHFRIFHNQAKDYAEAVAQTAESTRSRMSHKWFGKVEPDWTPKCDIYLHASASAYSQQTGQPGSSPGHSRIELDPAAGRVVARQLHLRCDNASLLDAVLPHETTHVVLAGQFGNHHVPRWVDEGVAVLTEPEEKVQQHRKNLSKSLQTRDLIPLRELLQMDNYPSPAQISTFYAQSVALVDYLTKQKSPVVFTQFVRDALKEGYDPALRKHYGFQSTAELQERFTERLLADNQTGQPAYAGR